MQYLHFVVCLAPYQRSSAAVPFLATRNTPIFLCFKQVKLPHLSPPTRPNEGEHVLKNLHQNTVI